MSKHDPTLCHETEIELPAFVAGELDDAARAAIEQHLAFCPGCQFEWRANEVAWRCLTQCGDVEPQADLRRRVLGAIPYYHRTHTSFSPRSYSELKELR